MRLPLPKIKEALLHADPEVREASGYHLAKSPEPDPRVMPLVIETIERYGLEAFQIPNFIQDLVQTDETVTWLLSQIQPLRDDADEQNVRYQKALVAALHRADALILGQHEAAIQAAENLDDSSKEVIDDRISVFAMSADALWMELTAFSNEVDNDDGIPDEDYEYCCSLVDALALYPHDCNGRVLLTLADESQWGGALEAMVIRLAGELRLEPAVALLIDRLEDSGTWACEEAYRALAKIGTDAVVRQIARRYADADASLRMALASTLEHIHTDLSVKMCLKLLDQEQEPDVRGNLLQSILMNFSPEGIEPARQHVQSTPKSPEMLEVRSALLVACKMTGDTFLEFEAWLEDSKQDVEFRKQWYKDHPLMQLAAALESPPKSTDHQVEHDAELLLDEMEHDFPASTVVHRQVPIGRNDPCPCGSGKKFKKCCYGKRAMFEETDE